MTKTLEEDFTVRDRLFNRIVVEMLRFHGSIFLEERNLISWPSKAKKEGPWEASISTSGVLEVFAGLFTKCHQKCE